MHIVTRALVAGLLALTLLAGCGTDTPVTPSDATASPAAPGDATAQPGNGAYPVVTPDPTQLAYPNPAP
jgi:hypothetical protein